MKHFFASLLGTLVALLLFAVGCGVLAIGTLGVLASLGKEHVVAVPEGGYLVLDLGMNLTDAPPSLDAEGLPAMFQGEDANVVQLRAATKALRAAGTDERIQGVVIVGAFEPGGYGTGFAALRELRTALEAFKATGKPVRAYLDNAGTREYYIASLAEDIALDPYGMIAMPGLASQPMFYAGAFERFGIGVQVTRVGKFKGAVEPYTRKDLSPENREQLQKLLDDVWADLRDTMARDRGLTADKLQALIDSGDLFQPEGAVKAGLVNRLAYRDEILAELREKTGPGDPKETFVQVSLRDYIKATQGPGTKAPTLAAATSKDGAVDATKTTRRGKIAVMYAEGAIVDGEGQAGEVGGEKFARELRKLRQDSSIKAIVLRVNSPGGSVSASEHIQREVRLARKEKPVVVSMGSYAASGGYWISTYSDRIFAEPTTITGSIGVFGVFFNVEKLANDLGITWDVVKTGKYADALTITRAQTPEETALAQRSVDWVYEQFINKVAESRKLAPAKVREIAQGRVWSGTEAINLGLVDELGNLDAALAFAAKQAKLGEDYRVVEYPKKKELAEVISEFFNQGHPFSSHVGARSAGGAVSQVVDTLKKQAATVEQFNDPRGLYARLPFDILAK